MNLSFAQSQSTSYRSAFAGFGHFFTSLVIQYIFFVQYCMLSNRWSQQFRLATQMQKWYDMD